MQNRPVERSARALVPLVLLLAGTAAFPQSAHEGVPVYTNDDLARFSTPETRDDADRPIAEGGGDWAFVQAFLAREHARIDADRRHDLSREQLEIAARKPEPRHVVPYWPYTYPYVRSPYRKRPHEDRIAGHGRGGRHGRFTHLKGADVVPGPKPPGQDAPPMHRPNRHGS